MHYKTCGISSRIVFFALAVIMGIFSLQPVTQAALIKADQVLGQLDVNGLPTFNQGERDSAFVNNYGFNGPYGIAVDTLHQRVFVAERENNRVLVFRTDEGGAIIDDGHASYVLGQNTFFENRENQGLGNATNATMRQPTSLEYDENTDRLYVADSENARVLVFDVATIDNGEAAISVIGQNNDFNLSLRSAAGIALDKVNGRLFVSDYNKNRVLVYAVNNPELPKAVLGQADFINTNPGLSASQVNNPFALAFNPETNNLFVSDYANYRVLVFDTTVVDNGENAVAVLGQNNFITNNFPAVNAHTFSMYYGQMSVDPVSKRLFLPDIFHSRTLVFDITTITNGEDAAYVLGQNNFNGQSANQGGEPSKSGLNSPCGVYFANGLLYVADTGNNRLLIYKTDIITNGKPAAAVLGQLDRFGNPSFSQNHINSGAVNNHGLSLDNSFTYSLSGSSDLDQINHRLFVSDSVNNRVLVFNLDSNNNPIDYQADYVLGQTDFISNTKPPFLTANPNSLLGPTDIVYDSARNQLFIADAGRVVIYDVSSITNGEAAIKVLGKENLNTLTPVNNQNTSAVNLLSATSLALDKDRGLLFVSEGYRVMIFEINDITSGEAAINVLGQPNFTTDNNNPAAQNNFGFASGLAYNHADQVLYVVDASNNRVLAFNVSTIGNGENASGILGQNNFTSNVVNFGAIIPTLSSPMGFSMPIDVAYNETAKTVYVADKFNYRVLSFDAASIDNDGGSAVAVLGRYGFQTSSHLPPPVSQNSFSYLFSVNFNPGRSMLYVTDMLNRLVGIQIFDLPKTILPNASVGASYSKAINPALYERGAVTYSLTSGALPPGLNFDPVTRIISGNPTQTGNFIFTITAKDTLQNEAGETEYYTDNEVYNIQVTSFIGSSNLNIKEVIDGTTGSIIIAPESANVQLGKWTIAAAGGNVSLRKLTLQVVDPANNTPLQILGTFGTLSLYDGATVLATSNYVNGTVVFSGFNSNIFGNGNKVYTLKGNINASGTMTSNRPAAFVIKSDSMSDVEARDSANNILTSASINYNTVTSNGPAETKFARSTVYNFHDAFPVITPIVFGTNLDKSINARLFKFTITNVGKKDLKFTSINISNNFNGLISRGSIRTFKLFLDNGMGLGQQLAQNNTMVQAGAVNPVQIVFDQSHQLNNLLDNLTIAPGTSKTFTMTANTANMDFALLPGGTISVQSKIIGQSGWNGAGWNTGNFSYKYTPVNGLELGPFSASDSYGSSGQIYTGELVYIL